MTHIDNSARAVADGPRHGNSWRALSRPGVPLILASALNLAQPSPASAGVTQISATGVVDTGGVCLPPPPGFGDFIDLTIVISGDLVGCWYTDILTAKNNGPPSGVYLETGRELFIGELDGEAIQFTTTYKFESKWDPEFPDGAELHGRCQHPIADGSKEFGDVEGRLFFKDIVEEGTFDIRGHIRRL
ncbi:hypothetical protein [Nannocystis punicea]|uniref:Allene oxide cyclase barrel-like domain-containing protein n=1 Tax=Nannocystis punicea TaxID=2995304 RepID=A0ABY7HBI3_9BACT|nr:hypothetical protein [Nannocystis poenicansa]WAS96467.1 hypothetical protein O0S08_09935 [Nannocystis poenicansa]